MNSSDYTTAAPEGFNAAEEHIINAAFESDRTAADPATVEAYHTYTPSQMADAIAPEIREEIAGRLLEKLQSSGSLAAGGSSIASKDGHTRIAVLGPKAIRAMAVEAVTATLYTPFSESFDVEQVVVLEMPARAHLESVSKEVHDSYLEEVKRFTNNTIINRDAQYRAMSTQLQSTPWWKMRLRKDRKEMAIRREAVANFMDDLSVSLLDYLRGMRLPTVRTPSTTCTPRATWNIQGMFSGSSNAFPNAPGGDGTAIPGSAFHPGNTLRFPRLQVHSGIPVCIQVENTSDVEATFCAVLLGNPVANANADKKETKAKTSKCRACPDIVTLGEVCESCQTPTDTSTIEHQVAAAQQIHTALYKGAVPDKVLDVHFQSPLSALLHFDNRPPCKLTGLLAAAIYNHDEAFTKKALESVTEVAR